MSAPATIDRFTGEYAFLSNFHPAPVEWMGLEVPTVEHGFQLAKTLDPEARRAIARTSAPGEAKRLGRRVVLRPDWEESKCVVMALLLLQKFTRHRDLAQALLATGSAELIEGNDWGDAFWGMVNGSGRNELGKQLMAVRGLLDSLDRRRP